MASYYDYNTDESLPPPAVGGNEPTNAPYDPRFETPYSPPAMPSPAAYNPYRGAGLPPNPWASPTPVPGGPGGPPSATITGGTPTPAPYDNYAGPSDVLNGPRGGGFGGVPSEGLDPSIGGMPWENQGMHYVTNPNGGTDIYDNNWNWVGNMPGGATAKNQENPPPMASNAYPQLSSRPGSLYPDVGPPTLGGFGQPMGYFPSGTEGPGPLSTFNPSNLGTNTPSAGAFWSPPGGSIGGPLGVGSAGTMFDNYYANESLYRLLHGGDTSLGFAGMRNLNAMPGGSGILPRSQWGGYQGGPIEASTQKPTGTAGITSGGGPGGIA